MHMHLEVITLAAAIPAAVRLVVHVVSVLGTVLAAPPDPVAIVKHIFAIGTDLVTAVADGVLFFFAAAGILKVRQGLRKEGYIEFFESAAGVALLSTFAVWVTYATGLL